MFAFLIALQIEFIFNPAQYNIYPQEVYIAGTFNGWNSKSHKLEKKGNIFRIKIDLPDGIHYYKFVADGKWLEDKTANPKLRKPDGFGGFNSGVFVGRSGYDMQNPSGAINKEALKIWFNFYSDEGFEVFVRMLENDASKTYFVFEDREYELEKYNSEFGFDYLKADIISTKKYEKINYTLKFYDEKWIEIKGSQTWKIDFYIPLWAYDAIWYQIQIDRFRNADTSNDPQNTLPWGWKWDRPYGKETLGFYTYVWDRYFGGDLQGLIQKLDYLKELGINAIYLMPVFEADSNHGYNTVDYRHIEENFGFRDYALTIKDEVYDDPSTWKFSKTDKLFLEFIKKAHENNIKVIIDGVFNHSGDKFWAFEDLKRNGRKSKYRDWYIIRNWDMFENSNEKWKYYQGWGGFGGLPEYKEYPDGLNPELEKHIFEITKRWMAPQSYEGIDGWRLDVPDNVNKEWWKKWCRLVKKINKEALITGELWGEAPEWLNSELFHSQMNYPLAKIATKFFIDKSIGTSEFIEELKNYFKLYPKQVYYAQLNLFDSHDTDRVLSMIMNPGRPYDKFNRLNPADGDYNPNYYNGRPDNTAFKTYKMMLVFQFTFVGAPVIYYGDEAGMFGSDDPHNRKPMLWEDIKFEDKNEKINYDILNHVKKLTALRKDRIELRRGNIEFIPEKILIYKRGYKDKNAYVFINNSKDTATVDFNFDGEYTEYFSGKKFSGEYRLKIEPYGFRVFTRN